MVEKDSSPKQWSDPKDFGLPFVEISPLVSSKTKVKSISPEVPLASLEPTKKPSLVAEERKIEPQPNKPVVSIPNPSKEVPKKSKAWVWVVVVILIAAISTIVWQLMVNETFINGLEGNQTETRALPLTAKEVNEFVSPTTNSVDSVPVQDSTLLSSPESSTGTVNSGTSIATPSKLIRIESKGANARFFIVVGSFGSEDEAMRFIQKIGNKFPEYYLVYPFDKNPNYRLAMGSYTNLNEASIKLAALKSESANSYWILNY
jgi:hypothetical protein